MIGTSLKSPMSGTVTWVVPAARASVMAVIVVSFPVARFGRRMLYAASGRQTVIGLGFSRIEAVSRDRLGHHLGLDRALLGQRLERRDGDPVPVHLEEVAQLPAVVRPAVAVGPEHPVAPRHPGADLVGEQPHVVGRRDHRPAPAGQARLDMAPARRFGRVQQVPALDLDRLAPQFGEAGHAPDVRRDAPVLRQQVGRRDDLPQDRAAAQQLHPPCCLRPWLPSLFCPSRNRYMPLRMPASAPSGMAGCS